ncbi:MAG: hypothetical protein KY396_07210, partial [Actinobacteria bacterium]|nr:hypothetical protein [Actinomycetota bacterium]
MSFRTLKALTTSTLTDLERVPPENEGARGETIGSPAKRQDRSPVPSAFAYAPAPESRDIVSVRERYGLFIGGEEV